MRGDRIRTLGRSLINLMLLRVMNSARMHIYGACACSLRKLLENHLACRRKLDHNRRPESECTCVAACSVLFRLESQTVFESTPTHRRRSFMNRDCSPNPILNLCFVTALCLLLPARILAAAPQPTTTVLTVSPGNTVTVGSAVTVQAFVTSGSKPVSPGQVLFCKAEAKYCEDPNILGKAQLRSDGSAALNLILAAGVHNIRADFVGTNSYAVSRSAWKTVNVTGGYLSTMDIGAAASTPPLALTATVTSFGQAAPTGSVLFRDPANKNVSLESETLGPPSFAFVSRGNPVQPPIYSYDIYTYIAVADFDGDGNLDLFSTDPGGANHVLFGRGDGTFTVGPVLFGIWASAVGDFNNDGIQDLLTINGPDFSIYLGNGDGTFVFSNRTSFRNLNNFGRAYVGDLNHDGNLDFVVTTDRDTEIYLGDGAGHFAEASALNVVAGNGPIRIADVNEDGKQDLIFGVGDFSGRAGVAVYLGNGDGTFVAGQPLAITCPLSCYDVLVADLNDDGKPDVAVSSLGYADGAPGGLSIFLGNSDGTFRAGANYGTESAALALGDFDGDGKLDIADTGLSGNGFPGYPAVYLGNGDGTFGEGIPLFPGKSDPNPSHPSYTFSCLGDFNNDGRTDFVPPNNYGPAYTSLSAWQATATANSGIENDTFGVHPVVANYAGDGTHLASSSAPVLLQGQRISTTLALNIMTSLPIAPGSTLRLVASLFPSAVGDAVPTGIVTFSNGAKVLATRPLVNGSAAIASLSASTLEIGLRTTTLTAYYSGDADFTPSTSPEVQLAKTGDLLPGSATVLNISPSPEVAAGTVVALTASVTNDGVPVTRGLVSFYRSIPRYNLETLLGQAQLTPNGVAAIKLRLGIGPQAIRAVFHGTNAVAGSASVSQDLTVTGLIHTNTRITADPPTYSASVSSYGPFVATGKVAFSDAAHDNNTFATALLGPDQASYVITAATTPPYLGNQQTSAVAADFNGDGIVDIATTIPGSQLVILLGKPDGSFYEKFSPLDNNYQYSLAVADFNGDGNPDLVIFDISASSLTILLGAGNGLFTREAPMALASPSSFVIGDFNNDGIPDLAVIDTQGNVSIYPGKGNGTFEEPSTVKLGVVPAGPAVVADLNGDGLPDLAVPVLTSVSPIILLLSNGDGTFVTRPVALPANIYRNGYSTVVAGDLNGDGIQDLLLNGIALLGKGDGSYAPRETSFYSTPTPSGILCDMNDDGIPDLVSLDYYDFSMTVELGRGDGSFDLGAYLEFPYGNGASAFAIGDFNGDGTPDVMSAVVYEPDYAPPPPRIETMAEWLGTVIRTATATAADAVPPGVGPHLIFARYSGDTTHSGSQSATVPVP